MSPKFEKVMNAKKLSLMFLWSLHCLEIPPGIFSSNHCTVKLLKQNNTRFQKCLLQQHVRISWHPHYIHSFSWNKQKFLREDTLFYFPGRCWYNRLWYNTNLLRSTELKKPDCLKPFTALLPIIRHLLYILLAVLGTLTAQLPLH